MQFQNYHANTKRLDITFTKFIKLHDCIPVNVGFAVYTRGRSRRRVQGVHTPPPPEMICGFLIQLVFCQKKKKLCGFSGVEVEQETSALPLKKNPGSAPVYSELSEFKWHELL